MTPTSAPFVKYVGTYYKQNEYKEYFKKMQYYPDSYAASNTPSIIEQKKRSVEGDSTLLCKHPRFRPHTRWR